MSLFKIYGIRHHGPGSSRSMLRALEAQQPDLILIEGPMEGQTALNLAANAEMLPPVALLIYDPANLSNANFFPFAEYSPEWVAMQFSFRAKIEARFMDFMPKVEEKPTLFFAENGVPNPSEILEKITDPFALLASIAGFSDHERWWEATLEHTDNQEVIFESILDLMRQMRVAKDIDETEETLLREAFMREQMRKAKKEKFQNVAVICGAWHAPVLEDVEKFSEKTDAALVKPFLKKPKTAAAWIPWTFERLAIKSGYGAGVQSPAWYQILWENRSDASVRWLLEAARLLRSQDLDASSAHVIDAVRLANTMATLRGLPIAGLDELRESARATLGDGSAEKLQLIENQLVIGSRMGQVPPDSPVVPLQADFEKQLKTLRLSEVLKSSSEIKLDIDLRAEPQLRKSQFLHRLQLLELKFAEEKQATGREQSTFHEYWTAKWQPEITLRLIERGVWGQTILEATTNFARKKINETSQLAPLVELLDAMLKADLPDLIAPLLKSLEDLAALTTDTVLLADSVPPLVRVLRYGSARKTDVLAVESVLNSLFPRICIGFPTACAGLSEEAADEILPKILAIHRIADRIYLSSMADWNGCLERIAAQKMTAPKLLGLAVRLLFDGKIFSKETTATQMSFALSQGASSADATSWLDGFLSGSGLLLVHQPGLFQILDEWVSGLNDEIFRETLPLLRRTFSRFSAPERQKILELNRNSGGFSKKTDVLAAVFDEKLGAAVLPILREILIE
jgi:Family of unknown function (DUF5682)